ncbi:hypothetical protein ENUP19_0359G0012 [Entamoeba nuttalli]|uniref:Uncharacterized protein n=2 Tax=Entamoeba nuttalli TaxID=412467 RepID=K2GWH9_ENTNP|nr:hypothetical protein ENU1_175550 [Entamoeba nuttalli P19]EKE38127.1 hypothetical protein ENU1_175550 [Entamoeba nuttalli P19]|eukprot:XP_008859537.1 hypothetical protein ENU1_175550 [Entamoeba nuttalli P19]
MSFRVSVYGIKDQLKLHETLRSNLRLNMLNKKRKNELVELSDSPVGYAQHQMYQDLLSSNDETVIQALDIFKNIIKSQECPLDILNASLFNQLNILTQRSVSVVEALLSLLCELVSSLDENVINIFFDCGLMSYLINVIKRPPSIDSIHIFIKSLDFLAELIYDRQTLRNNLLSKDLLVSLMDIIRIICNSPILNEESLTSLLRFLSCFTRGLPKEYNEFTNTLFFYLRDNFLKFHGDSEYDVLDIMKNTSVISPELIERVLEEGIMKQYVVLLMHVNEYCKLGLLNLITEWIQVYPNTIRYIDQFILSLLNLIPNSSVTILYHLIDFLYSINSIEKYHQRFNDLLLCSSNSVAFIIGCFTHNFVNIAYSSINFISTVLISSTNNVQIVQLLVNNYFIELGSFCLQRMFICSNERILFLLIKSILNIFEVESNYALACSSPIELFIQSKGDLYIEEVKPKSPETILLIEKIKTFLINETSTNENKI